MTLDPQSYDSIILRDYLTQSAWPGRSIRNHNPLPTRPVPWFWETQAASHRSKPERGRTPETRPDSGTDMSLWTDGLRHKPQPLVSAC